MLILTANPQPKPYAGPLPYRLASRVFVTSASVARVDASKRGIKGDGSETEADGENIRGHPRVLRR